MADKDQSPPLSPGEQLVAQGALVMRYENDQMAAVAIARPRDEAKVKSRALAILEADHEAANHAYYSIPYKEHTREGDCTGRSDDNCPVKEEVEGVGIDGASELARLWGNNTTRVYFTEEDDEWVRLSGVFVDLETNTRVEVPYAVSKIGVRRDGGVWTLNPTRLAQSIQSGVSKCRRNAITQGLPRHLIRAYYEKAKEIVTGSGAIDVGKLLEAFAAFGVSREQLEAFFNAGLEDLDGPGRRRLRGLFVAIREGLVKPEEYFPAGETAPAAAASSNMGHEAAAQPRERDKPSPVAGARAEVRGGHESREAAASRVQRDAPAREEQPPAGDGERVSPPPATPPPAKPAQATPAAVRSRTPNNPPEEPEQGELEDLGI